MSLQRDQKIFVNRSLNLGSIKAIGFDLDHTLVRYRRENFEALAFRKTLDKFIDAGYPEELLNLNFDPTYAIRGLLVDRERGNILKVDRHKYVKIAFHGKQRLDREMRYKLYNADTLKFSDFASVDTFFGLSEVQLFIEIVDYMDKNPSKISKNYKEVYKDLRQFIDESHRDGSIKTQVCQHPEIFINRDKFLSLALTRAIDSGKQLFLLTNSEWEYTDFVLKYILDDMLPDYPHWRDYFKYIIVGGAKPGFFTGDQPFYEVLPESNLLKIHRGKLDNDKVYFGGNAKLFQEFTGFKGDDILYVGDHLFSDIINSKGLFNWRTMLIVEELETELKIIDDIKEEYSQIFQHIKKREELDESVQLLRSRADSIARQLDVLSSRMETKKAQYLSNELTKVQEKFKLAKKELEDSEETIRAMVAKRDEKIHPVWGEIMKVGLENSRFAQQVEQYSCLYTSRVSNLRFYSPFKKFVSVHDLLPHEIEVLRT